MDFLSIFVLIPTLMVGAMAFAKTNDQVRKIAAGGAGIQLVLSFFLLYKFFAERASGNTADMLFQARYSWFHSLNIDYFVGVDGISVAMIMLTSIVVLTGVFASWTMESQIKEFFISLIVLATGVYGFFISLDLFTMFFFYEIAVIPMYLLIGLWGSGPKEYSAMKLTLMLMGGSALLLVGLLGIYGFSPMEGGKHTFDLLKIAATHVPVEAQRFFFPLTFIGFGVIGALFPFHTWSPDGHSSAPTAVSMLHAGVLMKLGGYGCFRVAVFLMPEAAHEMTWIFLALTTISVLYGALGAIQQRDLKYLNAYSSVSHCGMVLFGISILNQTSMTGAIMQMLSHGLMTALFFGLIGMIYYRTHTRNIDEMGGLMKVMPYLSVCYFIAGLASLGLPGLSGFVAEMMIFVGAFQQTGLMYKVATIIAASSIVVTAVYILRATGTLVLGPIRNPEFEHLPDAKWYDKVPTAILIVCVAAIGMSPLWLSDMITTSLQPILKNLAR